LPVLLYKSLFLSSGEPLDGTLGSQGFPFAWKGPGSQKADGKMCTGIPGTSTSIVDSKALLDVGCVASIVGAIGTLEHIDKVG
jgi:hypothetical protein